MRANEYSKWNFNTMSYLHKILVIFKLWYYVPIMLDTYSNHNLTIYINQKIIYFVL